MKMIFIGHSGPKGDRAGNLAIQNSFYINFRIKPSFTNYWMGA